MYYTMSRWNRRSLNLSFSRKRPTEYHYIQDFENTNEKECKRCDKNNDLIYEKNIALYTDMIKYLKKKNAELSALVNGNDDERRETLGQRLVLVREIQEKMNKILQEFADNSQSITPVMSFFLEAKDFFKKNDYQIDSRIFENCEHRIPTEGSSLGLQFIKKHLY